MCAFLLFLLFDYSGAIDNALILSFLVQYTDNITTIYGDFHAKASAAGAANYF